MSVQTTVRFIRVYRQQNASPKYFIKASRNMSIKNILNTCNKHPNWQPRGCYSLVDGIHWCCAWFLTLKWTGLFPQEGDLEAVVAGTWLSLCVLFHRAYLVYLNVRTCLFTYNVVCPVQGAIRYFVTHFFGTSLCCVVPFPSPLCSLNMNIHIIQ